MTKKSWLLVAVVIALGVFYVWQFTGWFKTKNLRVHVTIPPAIFKSAPGNNSSLATISFDRPFRLNEIKVVPLAEFQANAHALPLWHLVSDSNSAPAKFFFYGFQTGQPVRGLRPAVPGSVPQPLEPNVTYRIFITAGKLQGQQDFIIGGTLPAATNSASR